MNNTQQILEDMRKITMLTGEISSIHELNLKNWIFVAFDGVDSLEIDYDLTKETTTANSEGFIDFKITANKIDLNDFQKQGEFGKRCDTLTAWVRDMFWPEIRVDMYLNGQKYYSDSSKTGEAISKNFKEVEDGSK